MVKIVIENRAQKEVAVNDLALPVLHHLHANAIDWMHACGGKGRCTTCTMIVVGGAEQISPLTAAEARYRTLGALRQDERLACQALISGSILIRVPDEYKLPHVMYTDHRS